MDGEGELFRSTWHFLREVKRSLSYYAMGNLANNLWMNGDLMPV